MVLRIFPGVGFAELNQVVIEFPLHPVNDRHGIHLQWQGRRKELHAEHVILWRENGGDYERGSLMLNVRNIIDLEMRLGLVDPAFLPCIEA